MTPEEKKKILSYMISSQKRLVPVLAKIRPGMEGRFAFVMSKSGGFYALLADPKAVPPKSVEAAKLALGKGSVVRRGFLEHTTTGPYIFWVKALLPPLAKALMTGLKAVKPLGKATVQIMAKEKAELLSKEVPDDPDESGDPVVEDLDSSETDPSETDPSETDLSETDTDIEQELLEERLREEEALGGALALKQREQEYAALNQKGIEEREKRLEEERRSMELLPADDPRRAKELARLDVDLLLLARAQEDLEENVRQVKESRQR